MFRVSIHTVHRTSPWLLVVLAGCSGTSPDGNPIGARNVDARAPEATDAAHGDGGDAAALEAHPADARALDAAWDTTSAHDAAVRDAGVETEADAAGEGGLDSETDAGCTVEGIAGECLTTTACAAKTGYASTPGYCPGPADIECCTDAPSTADNPPPPEGWVLMQQSSVTSAMTSWAVMILNDPTDYPMYSTTTMLFGTQNVLAMVQWHPPDFQNSVVHRGVTLYVPS